MKYQIVYDQPGRLRVRMGMYAFDQEQAHGMEQMLMSETGISRVEASSKNGSLLIYYRNVRKSYILGLLRNMHRNNLPAAKATDETKKRETSEKFWDDILGMTARHFFIKWFMPAPIRWGVSIFHATKFVAKGLNALFHGKVNVAVLDMASILAAFSQGSQSTASSIMFLLRISDRLEEYTRKQTKNALTESLAMNIDTVWQVTEAGDVKVPLSRIVPGDKIRVQSGTMIPVDGIVASGDAMINESSLTGESAAVHKTEGSSVYAATAIEDGDLVIEVRKAVNETRISNIVGMIDTSETLKAGVQSKAEHLADSIVPFSFIASALTFAFTRNVTKALSILMVDYSCALRLSIPIAVISSMKEAADNRILVKGGKFLESFAEADTILFDKTGTLTSASPKVAKVLAFDEYTPEKVLRDGACLEEHFPHSVAKAIVRKAAEEGIEHREEHAKVEYVVAHGISTILRGKRAQIGSAHFIFEDEKNAYTDEIRNAEEQEMQGLSVIYLARDGRCVGMIGIEDPAREDAREVISGLREAGFRHIVMMTGDGEAAAKRVAAQLGIDEYHAQVLPEDKAAKVEELKARGSKVVMVGDGINDSPALAAADVSIAMKDSSDLAREVADITMLSASLEDLLTLRTLSKKLLRRIHGNFGFIMSFNTALLVLGVAGVMQPQTTALLHNLSTMAISGASMRPYLKKKDKAVPQLETSVQAV